MRVAFSSTVFLVLRLGSGTGRWPGLVVGGNANSHSNIVPTAHLCRLVALGWSNERIGDEMGVTLNTVRTHLANLRGKLDAETRLEAVMAAVRLGILELR